jgi:hypothetical protein
LDNTVQELAVISVAAPFGLGLAWHYEADWFAMFFAAAAGIAIFEAVQRSV